MASSSAIAAPWAMLGEVACASMEAMRCLRQMVDDLNRKQAAGPGGHSGTTLQSSVTDLTPDIGSSDKPHPGPANHHRKPILLATP
jgi:hypothetical protein